MMSYSVRMLSATTRRVVAFSRGSLRAAVKGQAYAFASL